MDIPQAHPAATLLIVDDTPTNLGVVVESLEGYGFRVLVAEDGEEGLERAEFARPDLILLDIMLPGIDGMEVCRRLKACPTTAAIPVIFMTALADTETKVAGFAAGGVDYVTKPLETPEVLARINTHLALRRMQLRLDEQNVQLLREMAERSAAQAALQQAYDDLQEADRCLKETQAQLLQSEKLAAIGVLAAGVAHEINNPIAFVGSNLRCMEEYVDRLLGLIAAYEACDPVLAKADPQAWEALARAKARVELEYVRQDILGLLSESGEGLVRVGKIVQDLKDFSHAGEGSWQFADIHRGLDSTLNVAAHVLEGKARIIKEYGVLPQVECIPQELNQVFMNILLNAVQAIPERGEIYIRTGMAGDEVWVEIADNGIGMDERTAARIFEPFFTTRPVGQGTGLGLSLSYAAVKRHHGSIAAHSEPGRGTTMRIRLPVRQPQAATAA